MFAKHGASWGLALAWHWFASLSLEQTEKKKEKKEYKQSTFCYFSNVYCYWFSRFFFLFCDKLILLSHCPFSDLSEYLPTAVTQGLPGLLWSFAGQTIDSLVHQLVSSLIKIMVSQWWGLSYLLKQSFVQLTMKANTLVSWSVLGSELQPGNGDGGNGPVFWSVFTETTQKRKKCVYACTLAFSGQSQSLSLNICSQLFQEHP